LQSAGKIVLQRLCHERWTKLIPFPKQDMKAACDVLNSNLETDHLAAWIEVDVETLVEQHLSYENIAASVKCGKTTDELGASDSENSHNDSCEIVVTELNKILENVNEVMT
jgi:hypothetical protein